MSKELRQKIGEQLELWESEFLEPLVAKRPLRRQRFKTSSGLTVPAVSTPGSEGVPDPDDYTSRLGFPPRRSGCHLTPEQCAACASIWSFPGAPGTTHGYLSSRTRPKSSPAARSLRDPASRSTALTSNPLPRCFFSHTPIA